MVNRPRLFTARSVIQAATRCAKASESLDTSTCAGVCGIGPSSGLRALRKTDRGDRIRIIRRVKHVRAGDYGVRSGFDDAPGVFAAEAAIDFDHRIEAALVAHPP